MQDTRYTNDLIAFYLDTVTSELDRSPASRSVLLATYETYRALQPPKPTYLEFVTDNSNQTEWWENRLRLLELLGSQQDEVVSYDVTAVLSRIEHLQAELIPEMIILDGRQGRHFEALHLLTHGLGDFDTAIKYCLLGGLRIFGSLESHGPVPPREEQAYLLNHLLTEFLRIEDLSSQIERTGDLLERFDGWFDIKQVLTALPDSWSVDIISGFLVNSLRRLVQEGHEMVMVKSLSSCQNLGATIELADGINTAGASIESAG